MNSTKRLLRFLTLITLATLFVAALAGCNSGDASSEASTDPEATAETIGLLAGASPNTSLLSIYAYDGASVYRVHTADIATTNAVLETLSGVSYSEAPDWTIDDVTLPVFGVEIGRADGTVIQAAWSNGYWIAQDGSVYHYDFDFNTLTSEYDLVGGMEFPNFSNFPNARTLTQDDTGWNTYLLTPVDALTPVRGVSMTLDSIEDGTAQLSITNSSGAEFNYGEFFEVQVQIAGTWYSVPVAQANVAFPDIAHILRAGEAATQSYNLNIYGDLPDGNYRIVAYGLSAEFTLP